MRYQVTHTTTFSYEAPVSQCLNEVRLSPRPLPFQEVQQSNIRVEPAPAFLRHRTDYFGNDVATFAVFEHHDHLKATAESIVDVKPEVLNGAESLTWEAARELIAAPSDEECLKASEFRFQSPYVPGFPALLKYAEDTFTPGRPLMEGVKELSHRINTEFTYDPKATSIDSPLAEVLRKKRGVCQDFAHVMIGALRSIRLPARYVSGYVRSGPKVQGAQASHAWVSVFVPGSGWLSLDPTNDLIPSDTHVTLAWGRDYGDVTPVKGVTLGGGGQTVEVAVYVKAVS